MTSGGQDNGSQKGIVGMLQKSFVIGASLSKPHTSNKLVMGCSCMKSYDAK